MALNVGVIGYSMQSFNEKQANKLIKDAFDEISEEASKNICVISGLTSLGIPKLAYEEADRRCWKTVGIACEKAYDYELYPVDEKQIVGKDWGDESETFLSEIDILVCIGGGKQSKSELKTAKDKGIKTYFYELESED